MFVTFTAGGRLETELHYSTSALGEAGSVGHLVITQTAKEGTSPEAPPRRLLHRRSLLFHLQILKIAARIAVSLYDVYVFPCVIVLVQYTPLSDI